MRWEHPQRGLLPPVQFISVAEEAGRVVPVGQEVLHEACRSAAEWRRSLPSLRVNVNLSGQQFQHPELVADTQFALQTSRLDPSALCLELTDCVVMRDAEGATATLQVRTATGHLPRLSRSRPFRTAARTSAEVAEVQGTSRLGAGWRGCRYRLDLPHESE